MSQSAIAVLTYRREKPLQDFLESIATHCPQYPLAIFEDCATFDGTAAFLMKDSKPLGYDTEFDSEGYEHTEPSGRKWTAWLARRNEGVAGQSNKAIRWMERNSYDHLCLCNDDLLAKGDFPMVYWTAHQKISVGLFTFCDLKNTNRATYEGPTVPVKGVRVKILPRMVGMMMSFTKKVVESIGYFDATYGKFGNEHCDYNNRARLMGFVSLSNQAQLALDVDTNTLVSQTDASGLIPSAVADFERPALDARANADVSRSASRYGYENFYRPFRLPHPSYANAFGMPNSGIPVHDLDRLGYEFVPDRVT